VMAIFDDMSEKIRRERAELIEHAIEAALANRVLRVRRRGHGREADFPEPEILGEVAVNSCDIQRVGRQGDAGANGAAPMPPQQLLDLWRNDIVAAGAAAEDAELVLQVAGAIDRDRDADAILGEKFDDLRPQQRRVRGETEIDFLAQLRRTLPRVTDRRLEDRKI